MSSVLSARRLARAHKALESLEDDLDEQLDDARSNSSNSEEACSLLSDIIDSLSGALADFESLERVLAQRRTQDDKKGPARPHSH